MKKPSRNKDTIGDLSRLPLSDVIAIANDKTQPSWRVAAAVKVLRAAKAGQVIGEEKGKLDGRDFPMGWEKRLSGGLCAVAIGVTSGRLSQLARDGCPRNQDGTYSMPDVVKWLRERSLETSGRSPLQEEKTRAEIDLLRAKIQHLQETMMQKSEHTEIVRGLISNLKEYWLAGTRKVAHEFIGCKSMQDAQNILTQFVQYGLNGMVGK